MILIDAEQLPEHKYVGVEHDRIDMWMPASAVYILAYKWGWNDALDNVQSFAPPVDAVEVVRCKDCIHRDPEDHKCDCGALERAGCVFPVADDYFCSWGERRKDGKAG